MGFFSKLKDNMGGSGVDVHLEAPVTAHLSDPFINVQVTVSSKDKPQTITKTYVELRRENRNKSAETSASTQREVIARIENTQTFALQPGQQQTLQLQLVLNKAEAVNEQLPENDTLKGFVNGLSKLQQVTNAFDDNSYTYELAAVADVEGIAFDPSDTQQMQILKPGEFGGGFNGRL